MHALIVVAIYALDILWYLIVAAAIMSWLLAFNVINYHNPFVRKVWNGLNAMTEPMLRPIRSLLPNLGGVDISPIIAILIIIFLQQLLVPDLR